MTNTCQRADWRKSPSANRLMHQLNFADFSEELVYLHKLDQNNNQTISCPFYIK
jgi:hypothetical protein